MKTWSKSWQASSKPGKQRKHQRNMPLHHRKKLLRASLSKELKKKHGRNALSVRKGDTVAVLRGQFRKKSGKVTQVWTTRARIFVEGVEQVKKDGSKVLYPLHPSNVQITSLLMEDKRRQKVVTRTGGKAHG